MASHSAPRHPTTNAAHTNEAGLAGRERGQRTAEKSAVQSGVRERKRRREEVASDEGVEEAGSAAARDKEHRVGRGLRGGQEGGRHGTGDVGMQHSHGRDGRGSNMVSVGKKGKRKLGALTRVGVPADERGMQSGSDNEPGEEDKASSSAPGGAHANAVCIRSVNRQQMRHCKGKLADACVILVDDKPPGTCTSVALAKPGSSVQRRDTAEEDCDETDSHSRRFVPGLKFEKETGKLIDMVPLFGSDRTAVKGKTFLRDDRCIDLFGILKYGTEQEQRAFWEALRLEKACKAKERAQHAKLDPSDPTSVAQHLAFLVSQGKAPKQEAAMGVVRELSRPLDMQARLVLSKHLLRAHLDGAAGPSGALADRVFGRCVGAREDAAQEPPGARIGQKGSVNTKATLMRDYAKLIYGKDGVKQAISSLSPNAAASGARNFASAASKAPGPNQSALGIAPVQSSSRNITTYQSSSRNITAYEQPITMLRTWPASASEAPVAACGGGMPMHSYQAQLLGLYRHRLSLAHQQQACGNVGAVSVSLAPMLALSAQLLARSAHGLQRPWEGLNGNDYQLTGIDGAPAACTGTLSPDEQTQAFAQKVKIRFAKQTEVLPRLHLLLKSFANNMVSSQSEQEKDAVLQELRAQLSSLFHRHEDLVTELLNIVNVVEPMRKVQNIKGLNYRSHHDALASLSLDNETNGASRHLRTDSAAFTYAQPKADAAFHARAGAKNVGGGAGDSVVCRVQADAHAAAHDEAAVAAIGCTMDEDAGSIAVRGAQAEKVAREVPILHAASPCLLPPQPYQHGQDESLGASEGASGVASTGEAAATLVDDNPKAWLKDLDASLPEADATARAPTPVLHPGVCADADKGPESVEHGAADGGIVAAEAASQQTVDHHLKESCVDPVSVSRRDQVALEPALQAERQEQSRTQQSQEVHPKQMPASSPEANAAVFAGNAVSCPDMLPDPCESQVKSDGGSDDETEASAACGSSEKHERSSSDAPLHAPALGSQQDCAGEMTQSARVTGMGEVANIRLSAEAHSGPEEEVPQQVRGGESGAGTLAEDRGVVNRELVSSTQSSPLRAMRSGFAASLSPLVVPAAGGNGPTDLLADTLDGIDESCPESHGKHNSLAPPITPKSANSASEISRRMSTSTVTGSYLLGHTSCSRGDQAGAGGSQGAGMIGAQPNRFEGRENVDEDAENIQMPPRIFELFAQHDRKSSMVSPLSAGASSSLHASKNLLVPQQGVLRPGDSGPSSMLARRAGPSGARMSSSTQGVDEEQGVRIPKVAPVNASSAGFALPNTTRKHVVSFEAAFGLL